MKMERLHIALEKEASMKSGDSLASTSSSIITIITTTTTITPMGV